MHIKKMNCGCDEQLAFTLTEQFASGSFNPQFRTLDDGSGFDHVAKCRAAHPHPEIGNGGGSNGSSGNGGNGGNGAEDQTNPSGNGGNGSNGGNNVGEDGSVVEELQCCGIYPNRFEFLSHGGSRSCCGEVTYDTNKHDCCADGFLGAIGSCARRRR